MTRSQIYDTVKDVLVQVGIAGIVKSSIRQKDKLAIYVGQGSEPGLVGPMASAIDPSLRTSLFNAISSGSVKSVGDLVSWLDARLNPPDN